MTDAFGCSLTSGARVDWARERWAQHEMRSGTVAFIRRGLAMVRLDGGGTCWAGRSQLVAHHTFEGA